MSRLIRGRISHLGVLIDPKNTNFVEEIEILIPVKLGIPISNFRGEVENVSVISDRGGHLVFPIGPKNINFVEYIEILHSVKFP